MGKARSGSEATSPLLRERLARIRTCEKSGESLKAYAERNGLSVHALYQAKKAARQAGLLPPHRRSDSKPARRPKRCKPARFVEAVATPLARERGPAWRLRLPGGEVLESSTALSLDQTLELIEVLRGHS